MIMKLLLYLEELLSGPKNFSAPSFSAYIDDKHDSESQLYRGRIGGEVSRGGVGNR